MDKHIINKLQNVEARSRTEELIKSHTISMLKEGDVGCHFNWLVQKDKDGLLECLSEDILIEQNSV